MAGCGPTPPTIYFTRGAAAWLRILRLSGASMGPARARLQRGKEVPHLLAHGSDVSPATTGMPVAPVRTSPGPGKPIRLIRRALDQPRTLREYAFTGLSQVALTVAPDATLYWGLLSVALALLSTSAAFSRSSQSWATSNNKVLDLAVLSTLVVVGVSVAGLVGLRWPWLLVSGLVGLLVLSVMTSAIVVYPLLRRRVPGSWWRLSLRLLASMAVLAVGPGLYYVSYADARSGCDGLAARLKPDEVASARRLLHLAPDQAIAQYTVLPSPLPEEISPARLGLLVCDAQAKVCPQPGRDSITFLLDHAEAVGPGPTYYEFIFKVPRALARPTTKPLRVLVRSASNLEPQAVIVAGQTDGNLEPDANLVARIDQIEDTPLWKRVLDSYSAREALPLLNVSGAPTVREDSAPTFTCAKSAWPWDVWSSDDRP